MKEFFDVYYQAGENPVFCYRSGLTVYEEVLSNGALVSGGWNTAGYPLNVLSNCATRIKPTDFSEPFVFKIDVNGQCVSFDLEFVDFTTEKSEENIRATLTLDSRIVPLRIKVHTLLDGSAMFTRWLELENLSSQPLNISRMVLFGGGLETMLAIDGENSYTVSYFDRDEWGKEGQFCKKQLQEGFMAIDTRFHRNRYRHPLVFISNETTGITWFCQIGWSGGCRFGIDLNRQRDAIEHGGACKDHLAFFAEVTGYSPLLVLAPDESYSLSEVHIGAVAGGTDDVVNSMHDHIRRSVLTLPSPCLIGCGMGAEHDMSVETSKAFIDQFAMMGGEVFIIDAGWQNPPGEEKKWSRYNGANVPHPDRYPRGIKEISDYCHKKGMKFALWVEIERLGIYCENYEKHPEWRAKNIYGEAARGMINMADPEIAKWAEDELARIITEYNIDLLRVDYNITIDSVFNMGDCGTGVKECLAQRNCDAVYGMYRRLKERFPDVVFENCAGGGGRTDLGMMKAFNHTWVSDWQKMPRSVAITNGMTMALPPERVDRLFAGMECHRTGSIDAHMRNTMLGHMSLNVISPATALINPAQMDFVRHSVKVYKEFIRPILNGCKIYHHTPEAKETVVIEINNNGKGALTAFALKGQKELTVKLKGTAAGKKYRVTLDNTGDSFETDGKTPITISLGSSYTSELVLYEEVIKR